jgi:hypothetical protein
MVNVSKLGESTQNPHLEELAGDAGASGLAHGSWYSNGKFKHWDTIPLVFPSPILDTNRDTERDTMEPLLYLGYKQGWDFQWANGIPWDSQIAQHLLSLEANAQPWKGHFDEERRRIFLGCLKGYYSRCSYNDILNIIMITIAMV